VPAGVVKGDPVVVGEIVGVALIDRQSDGYVTIDTQGVYELTVTGAVSAFGAVIYAVVASGLVTSLTTTASGNTRFGLAYGTQAGTGKLGVKPGYP
jgi:predicted RecA/RadA family phage recombinase